MPEASFEALAALLQHCEAVSRRMLEEAGEFYPFGAFVAADGKVAALAADTGQVRPSPKQLFEFLHGAIAQMAQEGKLVGYAIAANVDVPTKFQAPFKDGVRVHVETPGYSRDIYTPYRVLPYRAIRRFLVALPVIEYADSITVDTPPHVFSSNEPG